MTRFQPGPVISAMLADPRRRKRSFIRSTAAGRGHFAEATHSLVSFAMKLGDDVPFLVRDDGDLDAALHGIGIAKMRNAGEVCAAAHRLSAQSGL